MCGDRSGNAEIAGVGITDKVLNRSGGGCEYITLLSVISAFAVVFLHTNGCFWQYGDDGYWASANVIESLFYFAVPVFFMISGATLINYRDRYSTGRYALRRIKKTVVPFAAWSLIGAVYNVIVYRTRYDLKSFVNGFLSGQIIGVYWFFLPLFCVYMCIPLFASVDKKYRKNVFSYLAVAAFLINCAIPFFLSVFNVDMRWPFVVRVASENLFYCLVGYLLNEYELPKRGKVAVYVLSVAGLAVHIVGTYFLSRRAGSVVSTYKGYGNLPSVLYAVGIWVFFKDTGGKIMRSPFGSAVRFLAKYTFGIYLTHYFIMNLLLRILRRIGILGSTSLIYRLGAPFIIVLIAVTVVYIMRKIPVMKHIVP